MATIANQEISESGIADPTFTACDAGGDDWENSGTNFIAIKNNTEATAITITFTATTTSFDSPTYGPSTKANRTIEVDGQKVAFIGPFEPAAFNDADNLVAITYSAVTNLSIAVFTLGT